MATRRNDLDTLAFGLHKAIRKVMRLWRKVGCRPATKLDAARAMGHLNDTTRVAERVLKTLMYYEMIYSLGNGWVAVAPQIGALAQSESRRRHVK